MKNTLIKYTAFGTTAAKRALRNHGGLVATGFMMFLLIAIFSQLWITVGKDNNLSAYGLGVANLIWYVMITELIIVGAVKMHKSIEEDIRSGDIVYTLTRPISYFVMKQCDAMGQVMLRLPMLAVIGGLTAYGFADTLTIPSVFIVPALLYTLGAIFLLHLFYNLIGFTTFWIQDPSAPYLVFSKLVFVLGGIYLPIDFFSGWLHDISLNTPFPVILYGPAQFALNPTQETAIFWGIRLVLWIAVMFAANIAVMRVCTKRLCVNGG